ncbi:zinc finger protein 638 isoform X2 [Tenrec ecaudatus]|uniref:zinc finger protein 638 isoform X2 n=1 Tax=Tenrec ecaudatus TaxID=94439 RepID=UPI003F595664
MPRDAVPAGATGEAAAEAAAGAAEPSPVSAAVAASTVADPLRRFVLFLENFAPLVNSLNLGVANPLLLGPSPLHFAQIKTQLALQQLNAVASHGSTPPYPLLNQAFLKIAMSRPRFNPRGNFILQRPRAPNPSGMRLPGPFMRPGSMGLPRFYAAGRARGIPHRFAGHESYQNMGPQRMNVQVTQHRTDPRLTKEKLDFHEAQQKKGKLHGSRWDDEAPMSATVEVKQSSVAQVTEESPKVQSRYTKESASSILASFGLSNEDLEELSRYPDEQLTPENMPLILRDIRMRKMGRRLPNLPSQNRNKEIIGGEAVSRNVIDYGHASKYGYTEDPLEVCIYDPEIPTDEVKSEFQSQQSVSASAPSSNVICNSMFPVEDVFRQIDFPSESSNNQPYFPVERGTKMSGIHISGGQSALEPVKSTSQPVSQTVSQTTSQSGTSAVSQQSFSSELISTVSQRERVPREPVINSSNVGSGGNKKDYRSEADAPIQSPFGIVKASWLPKFSSAQKMKRLPTPSMMNDYYAASPRIFPHLCSLCNIECSHLKDWIQHQNTSTHIESCRQLHQQYPDWNPEILPSRRNEGSRKETQTPRRRSHSLSPRRSRRSSSRHRVRRSRSPLHYAYRPRSRSPRLCHRFVARYRSRSPNPPYRIKPAFSPEVYRSFRFERASRRLVRSSDREKALEDTLQRSRHGSETSKKKHLEAGDTGHSPTQKAKVSSGSKPSVKSASSTKADSAARSKSKNVEDGSLPESKQTSDKAVSLQRKVRKDQSLVVVVSDLPEDGCTEEDIRKVFQPLGKINEILIVPYRKEAYLEMEFKESVTTVLKSVEKSPLMIKAKRVKIRVPGKKKPQNKDVKKKTDSKKTSASTLKKDADTSKVIETVNSSSTAGSPKVNRFQHSFQIKQRMKKERTVEEFNTENLMDKIKTLPAKGGQTKISTKVIKSSGKSSSSVKSVITVAAKGTKASTKAAKSSGKKSLEVKKAIGVKNKESSKPMTLPAASGATENQEPVSKETEEMCVVLVSNLPLKGYSIEDIYNLAKPFGGLNDILLLSSHKKAYIEVSKKSGDSMVKFYTCFPISLDGTQLSISMVTENINLKDEEAVFTTLIKENDPEVNVEKSYDRFVHLDNLPEDGLQCVLCIGLQFGKVDNHIFMNNKNKAILQLDSPESAQSMYNFLKQNPQNIGDYVLTCTLSPKINSTEAQGGRDSEQGKESPDLKNSPVDESEVQTEAGSPSVKPSEVEEESTPNFETEPSVQGEEPCEDKLGKALCESDFIEAMEVESPGEELKVEIPLVVSTPGSIELFPKNVEETALNQQVYATDFENEEADIDNPEAELSSSDSAFVEERNIKGILEESPSEAEDFFSGIPECVVEAVAEVDQHATVSETVPPACAASLVPGISTGDDKAVGNRGVSGKSIGEKEENGSNTKDTPVVATGKIEKDDPRVLADKLEKIVSVMKQKPAENIVAKANPHRGGSQPSKAEEASTAPSVSSSKSAAKATTVSAKAKATASKSEHQKSLLRSVFRDQVNAEKKLAAKESDLLKPTSAGSYLAESSSSKSKLTPSGVSRGGSGRISALQGKDSKLDHREITKQSQETEARTAVMKRDDSSTKTVVGQSTKNSKSTTGRSSKSKEEPLFPFNLDEFVTVDEVVEEVNLSQAKENPPKGKRKDALKNSPPSEPNLKKKKGENSAPHVVEGELSFVTLDEIGEEEDAAAHLAQALVTVDEVIDEEELNLDEMVKDSNTLLTLDELIDQDDCISHSEPKDVTVLSMAEEQDLLKQERLVTVDEIGEVEEMPLNESADINFDPLTTKGSEGNTVKDSLGFISSQMPEDPSTLVTVDEIQDENNDLHLVTLDEVTEEDEDALADFNNLKEELNFVTVDEVGEEEDRENDLKVELAQQQNDHPTGNKEDREKGAVDTQTTNLLLSEVGQVDENVKEEDLKAMIESHFAAKTPTKRVRIGKSPPSEKTDEAEPAKEEEAFKISEVDEDSELDDSEPEHKRQKIEDPSLSPSEEPEVPADLDFLVPKAGFFCPICSLFYAGEQAMINHCKSTRHKQNTEKFMAKQKKEKDQSEAEERSSR